MTRWIAIWMSLLCAASASAAAHASAVELAEGWHNLEGVWLFRIDPDETGEAAGWAAPAYDDAAWRTLNAPGYWEPQGVTDPRPGQAPKPKGRLPWTDYDGVAWYRRHVVVPAAWAGQDLELGLGSVDDEDRTYVNGQLVGETGPDVAQAVAVRRRYTVPAATVRFGAENVLALRVKDGGGPGGLMGPLLYLLPKEKANAMATLPDSDRPLAERFVAPPAESRILKIVHGLPDTPADQDALVRDLVARGFGGMATNVRFENYLEDDEKWASFVHCMHRAKDAGMALWLYDELGYPSGTAGGITLRDHPEWEARGLLIADTLASGGAVALDVPPGTLVRAAAFPIADGVIDLDAPVELASHIAGGALAWDAPAGDWHVMIITEDRLYEGTHAAVSLARKFPYINLLMPEPTARFLEVTHARYAEHLGEDLGQWFEATFTDEPSLMSLFMRRQPWRVLPWAPALAAEFEARRGYLLEPGIPALIGDAGARGRAVRYDFWLTVAELVSENYFGQIQTWCREHNTRSGGHLLMEEALLTHVPLYGDLFRCARRVDAPSIDCLTSLPPQVPWFVARLFGSVADLEERAVTMSETSDHAQRYRPAGDTRPVQPVSEDEIRGTCNRLIMNGITTITSYYSFADLSSEQLVRLNEWIGRCCTSLKGGHQVADVAVLYPIESAWPRFAPAHNWTEDSPAAARQVDATYRMALDALYASARDLTIVDAQALIQAEARSGALHHGNLRWRVVVLPCADTLPMAAWQNLAVFWRSGGAIIALSALPANSESAFPSPEVQALATGIFGAADGASIHTNPAGGAGVFLPAGSEMLLPLAVDALIERDVRIPDPAGPIRSTHRRIDGHEVFFLINDSAAPWEGTASLAATGAGEQWDPAAGRMTPLASADAIPLRLGPYGGMLFRFDAPGPVARRHVAEGPLPGLNLSALPDTEPGVGKGEFVQGGLAPESHPARLALPGAPSARAWRAEATLTKGDVDTFLFVTFAYETPVDIANAACLTVDTAVPEGQRTPTPLRIILRDAGGVEYIANTRRALADAGTCRTAAPLTSFERAGWCTAPDRPLDFHAIAAINIGWGGYLGAQGETVTFTLGPPCRGDFEDKTAPSQPSEQ
ncbi:MAG: hypothetical protein JXR94_16570 [Candidatus Hydrogenedentes bacterium]|nr:hypothetical protein [Candidatus Hydrogenedentota bacterium]